MNPLYEISQGTKKSACPTKIGCDRKSIANPTDKWNKYTAISCNLRNQAASSKTVQFSFGSFDLILLKKWKY